jgi:diguanylate cyclase (GGDEF)-like protein
MPFPVISPILLLAIAALLPVLLWLPGMRGAVFLCLSPETFLPLHSILTSLFAVVAFAIFFIGWYSYHRAGEAREAFHAVLGIAFLVVGSLDLLHAWTFVGMPAFFSLNSPNRTESFWFLARACECLGLIGAHFVQRRGLKPRYPFLALGGAVLIIAWSVLAMFSSPISISGRGPTPLGLLLEAFLVLGFSLAFILIFRSDWEEEAKSFILASILFSGYAELCFLSHQNLTDVLSLIGFLYKGLAYLLLFRALVVSGIMAPYSKLEQMISLYRRAARQAQTDGMTGLLNHGCFMGHLNRQFQEARRYGRPLSLVMVDLDHFKQVNDTYGHRAGDQILLRVADALRFSIRDCDYASRYGGEELALLLPETSEEQAMALADRLRRQVSSLVARSQEVRVTASFGVAQLEEGDSCGDDLLERADQALYRAKGLGRDRVCNAEKI